MPGRPSGAGMGAFHGPGARCCRCAGISRSCSTRRRAARRCTPRRCPLRSSPAWRSASLRSPGWRLRRLSRRIARRGRRPIADEAPIPGIGRAFVGEWRRVLADRGVFSMLVIAPVFYGVFYPQPYLGQLVRKIPIAVVDDDRTALSRRLIQTLDADEAISVAVRAPALDVAQQALFERQVFGIVEIPPDTEREVSRAMRPACRPMSIPPISWSSTARCRASSKAPATRNLANASRGNRADGAAIRLALAATEPDRAADGAALQPDRRLCELRRAGRLRADHPADAADGGGDAGRPRLRSSGGSSRRMLPRHRSSAGPSPI